MTHVSSANGAFRNDSVYYYSFAQGISDTEGEEKIRRNTVKMKRKCKRFNDH